MHDNHGHKCKILVTVVVHIVTDKTYSDSGTRTGAACAGISPDRTKNAAVNNHFNHQKSFGVNWASICYIYIKYIAFLQLSEKLAAGPIDDRVKLSRRK